MTFYRRNLPHWHPEGKAIFLTWRLHGSLPAAVVRARKAGIASKASTAKNGCATDDFPSQAFSRMDAALDKANFGPLWLANPEIAAHAEYHVLRGAELDRYELHAYVIMPNHVHILLEPHRPLAKITTVLKGVSGCDANATLGRTGKPFWQDESFDHWIRNSSEFERTRHYIEWNPVRAKLVGRPQDWEWSSAGPRFSRGTAIPACALEISRKLQ